MKKWLEILIVLAVTVFLIDSVLSIKIKLINLGMMSAQQKQQEQQQLVQVLNGLKQEIDGLKQPKPVKQGIPQ